MGKGGGQVISRLASSSHVQLGGGTNPQVRVLEGFVGRHIDGDEVGVVEEERGQDNGWEEGDG